MVLFGNDREKHQKKIKMHQKKRCIKKNINASKKINDHEERGEGGKEGRRKGNKEGRRKGGKEGRKEGGKEGRREGGKEGRREGGKEKRREGRKEGRQAGRQEGRKEGNKEGRRKGGKEGRKEGGKEGRKEGRREGGKEGRRKGGKLERREGGKEGRRKEGRREGGKDARGERREGRKEGKKEGRKDHVCSQHLSSVICVHFIFIDLHRDLCLCTSFMFFLGTHCRGPLHPLLFFHQLPLLPTLLPFAHKHRFLGFIFSFFFFQNIHRDLCLCASFLIFSFLLAIYPLRLVPMCFSLGTHCGGRRCALPPAPPHPLLFLNRFPLLPTIPFFLHKHHRLFGLISSLLISIETCAYVLLS